MLIRDALFYGLAGLPSLSEEAVIAEIDKHLKPIADTIAALGVYPEGFCFCGRDCTLADVHHTPECNDMRVLLRNGFGVV